jgi:RPA family protein
MEGAVRLFAGEFNRSTLTVPDEDGKSAAWIVTPSGAYCRQVFIAGALVEIHEQGGMIHARVADPTGGFDLACGGTKMILAEQMQKIPMPSFISVSGRAQFFRSGGSPVVTVRPDHVRVIDRTVRDQWVITTAQATLFRLHDMHAALKGTSTDSRVLRAFSHYSPAVADLDAMADMVTGALKSVRTQQGVPVLQADPRDVVIEYLHTIDGPRGVAIEAVIEMAQAKDISKEAVLAVIESLVREDECYQPQKGYIKLL